MLIIANPLIFLLFVGSRTELQKKMVEMLVSVKAVWEEKKPVALKQKLCYRKVDTVL